MKNKIVSIFTIFTILIIAGSQFASSQQMDTDYQYDKEIDNKYIGDLTLYSFDGEKHDQLPKGFYLANYRSPFIVKNQTLSLNPNLNYIDYTTHLNSDGILFISGLYPTTDSTLNMELGVESDFWGNNFNIRTNNMWVQIQIRKNNNYRLTSYWYNDSGSLNNIYFEIPSTDIVDNKIQVSFISDEENRSNTVRYNDTLYIETPYAFFESRNLPYTHLSHPIIEIYPYISKEGTYCTIKIYSIEQQISRNIVTPHGTKTKTAFGLDGPHQPIEKYVLKGTDYMNEKSQRGTVWADVKYMDEKTINYIKDLLNNEWDLGIHYSTQLNDISLENSYELMYSEYEIISNLFSTPPTNWCSLQNKDNVTHAKYAYENLGMIWRNDKTGIGYYSHVGNLENRTWDWWEKSVDNSAIYPTFTHRLDEEIAIPYSIDYQKFEYFIDMYTQNEIQIVGFEEYYKRNINQKETSVNILEKNDDNLLFTVITNGYPCNLNIYIEQLNQPYTLIDMEDNGEVRYILNNDMSITFEAKNMHTYRFSYSVAEKKKEPFTEKHKDNIVAVGTFAIMALLIGYVTLSRNKGEKK